MCPCPAPKNLSDLELVKSNAALGFLIYDFCNGNIYPNSSPLRDTRDFTLTFQNHSSQT